MRPESYPLPNSAPVEGPRGALPQIWTRANRGRADSVRAGIMTNAIRGDALRAFDVDDRKLVWESPLPASAQAAAAGHGKSKSTMGDAVIGYALP